MGPPDNPDNQLEETNKLTTSMFGVRVYHLRTLLWTYLVWAFLNLLFALHFCQPLGHHVFGHFTRKPHYSRLPYYWVFLNICPLKGLVLMYWESDIDWFAVVPPGMVAVLFVVAGLFIKEWWARFLIIMGMSIWFLTGFVVLGIGV